MADKKKKREVIEWLIIVSIGLGLYVTGLHTQVIGFIQRSVLATGIITPDFDANSLTEASYDFPLSDINGERILFEDYKGKTVFINFWATWCPPCIAEMPDINDLYHEVNSDVAFLIISVDENQEKAKRFVANKGYDFPIYFPAGRIPANFKSNAIPTTLVISPDGRIVSKREGMAKYNTDAFKTFLINL